MRASGVRVAPQLTQVHVQGAPGLRTIDVDVDAPSVRCLTKLADRQAQTADVGDVRESQHARPGAEGDFECLDQLAGVGRVGRRADALHAQAKAGGAHVPGDVVGRVVLIPHDDLIACLEGQPVIDGVIGLAGVADQSDLIRGHA